MGQIIQAVRRFVQPYLTTSGRTAAKNLIWLSIFTILTQACSLIILFLLTRGLTKQHFGILSFALTLQSYFIIFGTAGLPSVVIREGTQNPDQLDAITTSHIVISGTFSILLCILVIAGVWLAPVSSDERVLLSLMAVANIAASVSLRPLFDIHHQQRMTGMISFAVEIAALTSFLTLYHTNNLTLRTVGCVFAAKWITLSVVHYLCYHFALRRVRLVISGDSIKRILRSSWLLMLSTFVATIPLNSGVLFVRIFNGETDAAIMGIATQVSAAYLMFASIGYRIIQPHVAGEYGLHRSFLRKVVLFSCVYYGSIMLLFALAGYLAIRLFLAANYQAAIAPMLMLLAATMVLWIRSAAQLYLIRVNAEREILVVTAITAILFIGACVLLTPHFSYYGVVASVAAAAICSLIAFVLLMRRRVVFEEK